MNFRTIRWVFVALAGMVLLGASTGFAQQSIDLDAFEEISPGKTSGKKVSGSKQQSKDNSGQFEEYRPQVREISGKDVPADPNAGRTPRKKVSQQDRGLPSVEARPRASQSAPRAVAPIATPPSDANYGRDGFNAQRSVDLPSANLSADMDFQQTLKELESRIETLKERVIETKSRLLTYSQKVAKGFAAGTKVALRVENDLGKNFLVEKVTFYLDGHLVYLKEFDEEEDLSSLAVYQGSVLPGRHRLDVELILRGDEGFFDFGHGARLKLESGEYFNANEGKVLQIGLVMFDRGGVLTDVEERPGVRFNIEERDVF